MKNYENMKGNLSMKKLIILTMMLMMALSPSVVMATTMLDVDYTLYENDGGVANASYLLGNVEVTISNAGSNTYLFSIVLENTSTLDAFSGDTSSVWLTGLGILLPDGFYVIDSPSDGAVLTPSSRVYSNGVDVTGTVFGASTPPETVGDVSREWGYLNGVSGHFNDFSQYFDTNTQFSTMTADADTQFEAGDLGSQPNALDGPPWGLISDAVQSMLMPDSYMPGAYGIVNGIEITAYVHGAGFNPADLEAWINDHDVVLTFGSPNAIPEPSTLLLMGIGLIALGFVGRKTLKYAKR